MSLTDEDKQWIVAQLQDVRTGIQGFRTELQDVRAGIQGFHTELQDVRAELQNVRAHIEETETKLLRAFHDWASPVEMRARSHSAALRAMDIEIESLSDRVAKMERPQ